MATLVDDSAEKIMSVYDEALDLSRFARMRLALCVPKTTSMQVKPHGDTYG
jgi:hypothetical protein